MFEIIVLLFTETVSLNLGPIQLPEVGVTSYTMSWFVPTELVSVCDIVD